MGTESNGSQDAVTRYYVAEARYRRQKNRFFSGVVGSWKSPMHTGGDGVAFYDPAFAKARDEAADALRALTPQQYLEHVLKLSEDQIKARGAQSARDRAEAA